LVCAFRQNDPAPGAEKDEGKKVKEAEGEKKKPKKEAPVYRHITRLFYRLDAEGFRPKDGFHIWVFDVATGEGQQLTRGKYDELSPSWSPDGQRIVFMSNHQPDPDRDNMRQDLWWVPAHGGKVRKIPTPAGPIEEPYFSPDGKKIAYLGHTNPDDAWGVTNYHVWTVGLAGRPPAKDLTPRFDSQAFDLTISDTGEGFEGAPVWSHDGKTVYFRSSIHGSTHLFAVTGAGRRLRRVTEGQMHVMGLAFAKKAPMAAAVLSTTTAPGEVHLLDLTGRHAGELHQITDFNKDLRAELQIQRPETVWFRSGKTRVQGWILKPPGFKRTRRYPAIVEIHGGPRTQYGYTFFHEMQLLAAQGYVVFYCNPRGSQGYGEDFAGAIVNDWGTVDYDDIMAGVEYLKKKKYVNAKRLGVTGGSYGGYMTNWIVGHTNIFKAAVTQRSVTDLRSFMGSSDIGFEDHREFGGFPWTNEEGYKRQSPITYVKNIRTPLLIIHSESDLRCSIEQAEQLYTSLKMMRRKVEFVRFPEEPHGLSRHGRPDRRLARLKFILDWFAKYLK
jgi:dipeptidyl aminopeptidase/acylaminoacyl peptidase